MPLVGLGGPGFGRHHGGHGVHFDAAASFLGLTEETLRTRLESGETLAEAAKAEGKTVDGLVDALVADEKKELDAAVAAGRITAAQRTHILAGLEDRITAVVNGEAGFGFRHGRGGPGAFGPAPESSPPDA
jgi:hypothetical protein